MGGGGLLMIVHKFGVFDAPLRLNIRLLKPIPCPLPAKRILCKLCWRKWNKSGGGNAPNEAINFFCVFPRSAAWPLSACYPSDPPEYTHHNIKDDSPPGTDWQSVRKITRSVPTSGTRHLPPPQGFRFYSKKWGTSKSDTRKPTNRKTGNKAGPWLVASSSQVQQKKKKKHSFIDPLKEITNNIPCIIPQCIGYLRLA